MKTIYAILISLLILVGVAGVVLALSSRPASVRFQKPKVVYHIKLYSGGSTVEEWDSTSSPSYGASAVSFFDSNTGNEVVVRGTVVVTLK